VGVGHSGLISLFHRWKEGAPPDDENFCVLEREKGPRINKEQIIKGLAELCTEHESKRQLADEQGVPLEEDLSMILGNYVESLAPHQKQCAQLLKENHSSWTN